MGGEVIIITQDPDDQPPTGTPEQTGARLFSEPRRKPKLALTNVHLSFDDNATAEDISTAVRRVLDLSHDLQRQ